MLDFTGKSLNDLGAFNECMDLGKDQANYCTMEFLYHSAMARGVLPQYVGVCVPAACAESQLLNSTSYIVYNMTQLNINTTNVSFHCQIREPVPLGWGAIVAIVLIALIASLVIIGTVLEGLDMHRRNEELRSISVSGTFQQYQAIPETDPTSRSAQVLRQDTLPINGEGAMPKRRESKLTIFFKCFAIQPNMRFLIADNTNNGASPLASLNGLRVAMMAWIILGHTTTYSMYPVGYDNDLEVSSRVMTARSFQVVPAAEFAVDVFFYISGFLVMFMLLKELNQKKGKLPWGLFYFHRYWRLTPVFAFIMLVYTTLTPYMVYGPLTYQYRGAKTDLCLENWWTNLLYINNFVPQSSGAQCMGWTWFLANDMQFYIFTPIIALLFRKKRMGGWVLSAFLIIFSMFINWFLALKYDLSPMNPNDDQFNSILYNKPYARMAAYVQGIVVAFLLQYDSIDLVSNRLVRYVGYIVSFAVTWCPTYLTTSFWEAGGKWPLMSNLMYITFSRTGFVGAIMFVMYAMYKGHGFLLRPFLSHPFWVPLARLTYTAYLLHPIIIFVQYFSTPQIFDMNPIFIMQHYITNLVLAYSVGLVFHLAVEKPTANLERLLLPHKK
eukprot:TRINITY_DN242_c0_g1_i2.p1 TRINITY_DN242_c0_g1~~TRINITY_DN242_c0_g1_i2.p1  ORF type:complete len:679 (-),score=198.27 TRINITY_DN242_c0_g1_i2:79-1908(-)